MASRNTGAPPGTMASLIRPTVPMGESGDVLQDDAAGENEGRGENGSMSAAAPKRRRRPAPTGKTKPCKLHLPETLHDRLWYTARARRTTVSAIAAKLLDQHLPEWELTQKVS